MSTEKSISAHDREAIRKLINDKIVNYLTGKDIKKQEAAASATWQLAKMDQETNKGQLSQEQQRTHLPALSLISTVNITNQTNAYGLNAF